MDFTPTQLIESGTQLLNLIRLELDSTQLNLIHFGKKKIWSSFSQKIFVRIIIRRLEISKLANSSKFLGFYCFDAQKSHFYHHFSANFRSKLWPKINTIFNWVGPTQLSNLIRLGLISTQLNLIRCQLNSKSEIMYPKNRLVRKIPEVLFFLWLVMRFPTDDHSIRIRRKIIELQSYIQSIFDDIKCMIVIQ